VLDIVIFAEIHGNSPINFPISQKYTPTLNTMYCELFGSPSHNMNQCGAMDALAERLDHSAFIVNEGCQGTGRGHGVGGGYHGGQVGGRGLVNYYNYDEKRNWVRDRPLPRRPWCAHYGNNTHATEDCLEMIDKWQDHARHRGENMINYEPRAMDERGGPNVNIITRGGAKIGAFVESTHHINIQKVV
jgi:hypothetical protein